MQLDLSEADTLKTCSILIYQCFQQSLYAQEKWHYTAVDKIEIQMKSEIN
jgi:hypothetical protein